MVRQFLDYITHSFNPDNFKLVMTILVKNEEDIIEKNITTHTKLGVDAFVVMDNNSTDETQNILKKLQEDYEITIIEEHGLYNQAKWMKRLAYEAKKIYKADWVINNDADEFWIPQNGHTNLKEILKFKGSVITCHRYNMLLTSDIEDCFESLYRVNNPIYYRKETQETSEKVSIVLAKNSPKVIINPNGLFMIRGGNHKALHIANMKDYFTTYDKIKRFPEIVVYHYPIRSYEQFEKNIINRKNLLESGKKIKMGPHYRRWVKIYNEGGLKDEFDTNVVFQQKEIEVLEKFDVVKKDESIKDKI
ncbi:MAG: glycosyltransferase family 2 protein [Campylobacterota bacterium]|nr:glycosyltransferase family 2 protein [Campylobacterota bacterium]